ncbi:MAG: ROK family protein [Anaerolineaceae bacterium]|nr:ROK family protein [Anaerolineaceae bacterium]
MGILSIDFGGTQTRVAWFDSHLTMQVRKDSRTRREDGIAAVIGRIITLARDVMPEPGKDSLQAIGICAPGPQAYTGIILNASTLPGWDQIPLAKIISEALGAPAYMENDANLGALAEYHRGAAQGADPALYLTVSTGIGGGAVINGHLFTGWQGMALEPGHMKFRHPDGQFYSLEALASGTGIGRLARVRLAAYHTPSVLRALAVVDGRAVGEAAAQGDALAREVITESGEWLGWGLLSLVHLFNPRVIVMGGSVSLLGDLILAPARRILAENVIDPLFLPADLIRPAQLGDDVCLIGAAMHARAQFEAHK